MTKRERDIQGEIMLAVGSLPYARCWRQTVGTFRFLRSDGIVKVGMPGMADISGILACGRRLEIECKTASGRLSKAQVRWGRMVARMGGVWIVGREEAAVAAILEEHRQGCETCRDAVAIFGRGGG